MSKFIVGDIHGCYDKFIKVMELAKVNLNKGDTLYSLGDFCDRGKQISSVFNFLYLALENYPDNFKPVFGNHDIWIYQYLDEKFNNKPMGRDVVDCWKYNGGMNTLRSLSGMDEEVSKKLYEWLGNLPYRIETDNYWIQHTTIKDEKILRGIEPTKLTLKQCMDEEICGKDYDSWFFSRDAIYSSDIIFGNRAIKNEKYTPTEKTLITGHTPILGGPCYDYKLNLLDLDAGSFVTKKEHRTEIDGDIVILNLDTKEWYRSDGSEGILEIKE